VLNKVNLFRYAYTGLLRNEFQGLALSCTDSEMVGPPPPAPLVRAALKAMGVAWPERRCPMTTGENALDRMGVAEFSPAWACVALVIMGLGYRIAAYAALRRRFRSPLPERKS